MTDKLKTILFVHSSNEMYGADKNLLQLAESLQGETLRAIVVLPTDVHYEGTLGDELEKRGIKTVYFKIAILRRQYFTPLGVLLYFWRLIVSTFVIARLIRRESVSLVHSNTLAVIPGALAAVITRRPHIWHIHEILTKPKFLWKATSWWIPRLSDKVVCVSEATRAHLCRGNSRNERNSIVLQNGIEADEFQRSKGAGARVRHEWNIAPEHVLVGMIGRISHWKGQDHFMQAIKLVAPHFPQARFALVGGTLHGQEHLIGELLEQADSCGLAEVVRVNDFRRDVAAVLDAYDVFVLPSTLPDPFPTVILEAMASARPVVANAHGGSCEMIEDQRTGFLVDPMNVQEMANAIIKLIPDAELRRRMGERAADRFRERFSLARFVRDWHELYAGLCGDWPAAHAERSMAELHSS